MPTQTSWLWEVCVKPCWLNPRQGQQETKTTIKVSQTHTMNLSTAQPPSDDGDGGGGGGGDGGLLLGPA